MKHSTTEKKNLVKIICPSCHSSTHEWKDAYYDSGTVLKKTEKQYIAWCINIEQFVLSSN